MNNKKTQKNAFYICEKCSFNSDNKTDYKRHTTTPKHLNNINLITINNEKTEKNASYMCSCGNEYKYQSGLCAHKKKCIKNEEKEKEKEKEDEICESENNITPDLILNIIQQNQEFKDLLIEQNKIIIELSKNNNMTNINYSMNNSNNNSNNKSFNLNFFLNETCKDAMNIMDFVDSIKIQLADIESIGELGYVNGISKLIIKNLKALDENQRPVHSTDPKRES